MAAFIAGLIVAAPGDSRAAGKSIRGLELGMTAPAAIHSLAADLREGLQVISIPEPNPSVKRYRLSSGDLECGWTRRDQREKCIKLVAFGWGTPESGGLYSIELRQFFEEPIDFAAFEQRIREAYGEPTLSIGFRAAGFVLDNAYWLWSDEPFARTEEARRWASSITADAFNVSEPGKKFGAPVLHLSAYLRNGQVRGMQVMLFDPAVHHAQTVASQAWMKKTQEDEERKAREAAQGVQLR